MLQHDDNAEMSDQSELDSLLGSDVGPSDLRTDSAKRAIKTATKMPRRSRVYSP